MSEPARAADADRRDSFSEVVLVGRLREAIRRLNPAIPEEAREEALRNQLFGQFQRCADILGQTPVRAANRDNLRDLLAVASGGVVFTTIHKFLPEKGDPPAPGGRRAGKMPALSTRRNIVVIADEAQRSQYDLIDGLARHMRDALPDASFIGFTGTPIEKTDANTRAIQSGSSSWPPTWWRISRSGCPRCRIVLVAGAARRGHSGGCYDRYEFTPPAGGGACQDDEARGRVSGRCGW